MRAVMWVMSSMKDTTASTASRVSLSTCSTIRRNSAVLRLSALSRSVSIVSRIPSSTTRLASISRLIRSRSMADSLKDCNALAMAPISSCRLSPTTIRSVPPLARIPMSLAMAVIGCAICRVRSQVTIPQSMSARAIITDVEITESEFAERTA